MSSAMTRLQKLQELQNRDLAIKEVQASLNADISKFMSEELGINGPATLVDIVKKAIETSYEPIIKAP